MQRIFRLPYASLIFSFTVPVSLVIVEIRYVKHDNPAKLSPGDQKIFGWPLFMPLLFRSFLATYCRRISTLIYNFFSHSENFTRRASALLFQKNNKEQNKIFNVFFNLSLNCIEAADATKRAETFPE